MYYTTGCGCRPTKETNTLPRTNMSVGSDQLVLLATAPRKKKKAYHKICITGIGRKLVKTNADTACILVWCFAR